MAIDYSMARGNSLVKKATKTQASTLNSEKIYSLDMSKIHENPDNSRIFNMNGIDGLANVIKEDGFTGAIEVFVRDDGEYEILSGHRRYEACKAAGMKNIPAIILPKTDEVSRAKKLITSNIFNRELTAMDKARAMEYYEKHVLKPSGVRNIQKELAKVFDISETQVKYIRRILNYAPELQDLLEKDLIPYSGIVTATHLSEDEQKELAYTYNKIIENNNGEPLSKAQVSDICQQKINNHKIADDAKEVDRSEAAPAIQSEHSRTSIDEFGSSDDISSTDDDNKPETSRSAKDKTDSTAPEIVRKEHERLVLYAVDLLKKNLILDDLSEEFRSSVKEELEKIANSL